MRLIQRFFFTHYGALLALSCVFSLHSPAMAHLPSTQTTQPGNRLAIDEAPPPPATAKALPEADLRLWVQLEGVPGNQDFFLRIERHGQHFDAPRRWQANLIIDQKVQGQHFVRPTIASGRLVARVAAEDTVLWPKTVTGLSIAANFRCEGPQAQLTDVALIRQVALQEGYRDFAVLGLQDNNASLKDVMQLLYRGDGAFIGITISHVLGATDNACVALRGNGWPAEKAAELASWQRKLPVACPVGLSPALLSHMLGIVPAITLVKPVSLVPRTIPDHAFDPNPGWPLNPPDQ